MSDNSRKSINKDGPWPTFCCRVDRKTRMPERFANHAIEKRSEKPLYSTTANATHVAWNENGFILYGDVYQLMQSK